MSRRRLVARRGGLSVALQARPLGMGAALGAATLAGLVAAVSLGEFPVPPLDVLSALAGRADGGTRFVVVDLRLPRALAGALAGAALGAAGAVFQLVSRNPLASPDVVGVTGGASLAAVAVVVLGAGAGTPWVPLAAAAGAGAAGALLYGLAWRGGLHGARLVLVGVGLAAVAQAGIAYVLTEGRIFEVADAYVWLVGSLANRGWPDVWPLVAALAALAPVVAILGRRLDALALGDDLARGLGVAVERTRLALLAAAVALTGAAVAAAGPIGFVAFVSPHLSRRLGDPSTAWGLTGVAAACGALLVVAADLLSRLAFRPTELPVGLVTSIVAAPYFLLLLRRGLRREVTG